jgi:hypothetical protein
VVPLANPKPEEVRFRVEIGRFGLARRVGIARNVAPKSVKIDTLTLFHPKIASVGLRLRKWAVRSGFSHHFPQILSGTTGVEGRVMMIDFTVRGHL